MTKCHAIDGKSIYEIEDKINEFTQAHTVFSWNVFLKPDGTYDALIGYRLNNVEPIIESKDYTSEKQDLPSEKQIGALKKMGLYREGMSKQDAWKIINDRSPKKWKK